MYSGLLEAAGMRVGGAFLVPGLEGLTAGATSKLFRLFDNEGANGRGVHLG